MEIEENLEKLEKKVEKQSLAMELLEYSKEQNGQLEKANKSLIKANKSLIIVLIIVLILWFATIGIFIYYINTTGYEEDYREQTVEDVDNITDSNLVNGDAYGENKTSKEN